MLLKIAGNSQQRAQDILAADIGATKTTAGICHWDGEKISIIRESTFRTRNFRDAGALVSSFLGKETIPAKTCLAVAGPVLDGQACLTNINLKINGREVSDQFNTSAVLINDLEAAAYGLGVLQPEDVHVVHKGESSKGNAAIIAPGTGLGEAGLFLDKNGYHPFATEGGHCDFAPETVLDAELYHFLRRELYHVSWERVVSGPGICSIYDFLVAEKEMEEPSWLTEKILVHDKAAVITENASECVLCHQATDLFLRYLARESANLVLKLKATGGLFIAGGIIPELVHLIHEDHFLKCFSGSGRLRALLQSVPIKIIMNKKLPLLGAAYYGAVINPNE